MPAVTKSITLQEDKPSLRFTSGLLRGGRLASARRICWCWSPSSMENSFFSWNFVIWHVPRVHPCKPCYRLNFFHIQWIALKLCMCKVTTPVAGGKLFLAKTNWFFHAKSSLSHPIFIHKSRLTCHSTCPLPHRIFCLCESVQNMWPVLIVCEQAIYNCGCPNPLEIAIVHTSSSYHGCIHANLVSGIVSIPYGLNCVLYVQSYNPSGKRKNTPGENSLRGQAVSTSHFRIHAQRQFCMGKWILRFWMSPTPQKSLFFIKFRHMTRTTGAPMQNLASGQT